MVPEPAAVTSAPTDFADLLRRLLSGAVECILVGGVAANLRGSVRATYDVDFVYRRSHENLERIVHVLAPIHPYKRGAPPGLPFIFDVETLRRGMNFTLSTTSGDIDLRGEVAGIGTYDALLPLSDTVQTFGFACRCATVEALIRMKRAAGRPKDLEAIAELEALREQGA
jgi:hypothetical protein